MTGPTSTSVTPVFTPSSSHISSFTSSYNPGAPFSFNAGTLGTNSYLPALGNTNTASFTTGPVTKPSLIAPINPAPNTTFTPSSSNNNESLFTPPSFIYSTIQQVPVTGTNFMANKNYADNKFSAGTAFTNLDTFKYGTGFNNYVNKSGLDSGSTSGMDFKDTKTSVNLPGLKK